VFGDTPVVFAGAPVVFEGAAVVSAGGSHLTNAAKQTENEKRKLNELYLFFLLLLLLLYPSSYLPSLLPSQPSPILSHKDSN
jgi:hypothetical protein